VVLPSYQNEKDLSNRFCEFFLGKIDTIRSGLCASIGEMSGIRDFLSAEHTFEGENLHVLSPATLKKSERLF
jgi:hypothetical protein